MRGERSGRSRLSPSLSGRLERTATRSVLEGCSCAGGPWGRGRDLAGAPAGFALAVTLFVLVIVSAVVAGGYFVVEQHSRAAAAGAQANAALYAADAGLGAALANLDTAIVDSLLPGATISLLNGALSSGDEYRVSLTRLDVGLSGPTAYYLARATGHAHGPRGGRRELARFLRRPAFRPRCCDAALTGVGPVRVADGAVIDGYDPSPEGVAAVSCGQAAATSLPGLMSDDPGLVQLSGGGQVLGAPPIAATDAATVRSEVDRWLRELRRHADITFPGGVTLDKVGPVIDSQGGCDSTVRTNWGAPGATAHPCFDHLPLVHVDGQLRVRGPVAGQGILLVEGDLTLEGGFAFHGVVVARGRLRASGAGTRIYGGALVGNEAPGTNEAVDQAVLRYSGCAVARALEGSKLHLPHPLAEFSWLEILE